MQNICSLMDDHEVMEAMADQLIYLSRSGSGSAQECRALLERLKVELTAHRAAEASFMDSGADERRDDRFDAELAAFTHEYSELSKGWNHYLCHWTVETISGDRSGFAQETSDMMTAFKLRIERANSVIYPLALETGRIAFSD